jgi:hypothetical protein
MEQVNSRKACLARVRVHLMIGNELSEKALSIAVRSYYPQKHFGRLLCGRPVLADVSI